MQLQARYYSGIFWGPLQLVSAAIPKNSGYSMIVSVVIICWYMIVYRRDSTSRQFTHRCTVRIMCLSDTVHTQQGFPSIVYFVRPVPSQSKTLSCSHDFEVGLDWFMEFVRNDIEQQSLLYLSNIYIIYIDAHPVFQDIVCKWQLRPTVCLLAQPYIWKTPRLMLLLAALSVLSIRMVVQLVELSGKGSYEDRYWA